MEKTPLCKIKLLNKTNKICGCSKLENSKLNGYGILLNTNNNNIIYEGEWYNDKKHGTGILYDSYGNLEYDGEWYNDNKQGQGLLYYDKGTEMNNNKMFHYEQENQSKLLNDC